MRLLGMLPLVIGLKELIHAHQLKSGEVGRTDRSFSVLSIAAIALANGVFAALRERQGFV
jgi:cadmium resistance protein CadD (predicted permease)